MSLAAMELDSQSQSSSKKRRITTQTPRASSSGSTIASPPPVPAQVSASASSSSVFRAPPTNVVLKSCDGSRFTCSCAALSYAFVFFRTMFDLPVPEGTSSLAPQEIEMTEQAVVISKILSIVDPNHSVSGNVNLEDYTVADLQTPVTTEAAGNEDAPPEDELAEMEADFRLVALAIEAAVKFEASRPIVDSLAWFLRPYAHYRPLQAYSLAAKLEHAPLMSEVSVQFLNYNLTIIKERFWQEIGPRAALKVYQLHYNRQHHIFKAVQKLLADEFDAVASDASRCRSSSEHRAEFLRILGDWLATPGHDYEDLRIWISNEANLCIACTRHWSALVARLKESYAGPERLEAS